MTTPEKLLLLHDQQVRGTIAARLPSAWKRSWDGPVLRIITPKRGFAFAHDIDDLSMGELDALIRRVQEFFAKHDQTVEWKTYGHDRHDLTERLRRAGFEPEAEETVLVGLVADLATGGSAPGGVTIRSARDPVDLRRIAEMESEVWGTDVSWLADDLACRIESAPENIAILIAEADGKVVSAAWLAVLAGTDFGGLWGGSTLAAWRRKGIYRALVARRAQIAAKRGLKYLMVDASDDSRPILRRLGLQAVTTTTPWAWTPKA